MDAIDDAFLLQIEIPPSKKELVNGQQGVQSTTSERGNHLEWTCRSCNLVHESRVSVCSNCGKNKYGTSILVNPNPDNDGNDTHKPRQTSMTQYFVTNTEVESKEEQTTVNEEEAKKLVQHFNVSVFGGGGGNIIKLCEQTASTWVYPSNVSMRKYQYDISKRALLENTLVVLPTGLGKTLIAAVVMYNFYRWYPGGKILFMAHTRALVTQQINACHSFMGIPRKELTVLSGSKNAASRTPLWKSARIFFATPETVRMDMERGICPRESIVCMVVDEAHKATGNFAYVVVTKDILKVNRNFRVLALTATPGTDKKAIVEVTRNLCISNLEVRDESDADVRQYLQGRDVEAMIVTPTETQSRCRKLYLELCNKPVARLRNNNFFFNPEFAHSFMIQNRVRDLISRPPPNLTKDQINQTKNDLYLLSGMVRGRDHPFVYGLDMFLEFLQNEFVQHKFRNQFGRADIRNDPRFDEIINLIQSEVHSGRSPPKLIALEELILDHFATYKANGKSTRVIVFSGLRNSVERIVTCLETHESIKVMKFVGQSGKKGLSSKKQQEVIKAFREGGYNTLVCTSIGEEGLDIGEVDLIVNYDTNTSLISMIQRAGRTGRKRAGRVVNLISEGSERQKYEKVLKQKQDFMNMIRTKRGIKTSLYTENPRMLPKRIQPKCVQMDLATHRATDVFESRTSSSTSKQQRGAFLAEEEQHLFEINVRLSESEFDALAEEPITLDLYIQEQFISDKSHLFGHSKRSKLLVHSVSMIEVPQLRDVMLLSCAVCQKHKEDKSLSRIREDSEPPEEDVYMIDIDEDGSGGVEYASPYDQDRDHDQGQGRGIEYEYDEPDQEACNRRPEPDPASEQMEQDSMRTQGVEYRLEPMLEEIEQVPIVTTSYFHSILHRSAMIAALQKQHQAAVARSRPVVHLFPTDPLQLCVDPPRMDELVDHTTSHQNKEMGNGRTWVCLSNESEDREEQHSGSRRVEHQQLEEEHQSEADALRDANEPPHDNSDHQSARCSNALSIPDTPDIHPTRPEQNNQATPSHVREVVAREAESAETSCMALETHILTPADPSHSGQKAELQTPRKTTTPSQSTESPSPVIFRKRRKLSKIADAIADSPVLESSQVMLKKLRRGPSSEDNSLVHDTEPTEPNRLATIAEEGDSIVISQVDLVSQSSGCDQDSEAESIPSVKRRGRTRIPHRERKQKRKKPISKFVDVEAQSSDDDEYDDSADTIKKKKKKGKQLSSKRRKTKRSAMDSDSDLDSNKGKRDEDDDDDDDEEEEEVSTDLDGFIVRESQESESHMGSNTSQEERTPMRAIYQRSLLSFTPATPEVQQIIIPDQASEGEESVVDVTCSASGSERRTTPGSGSNRFGSASTPRSARPSLLTPKHTSSSTRLAQKLDFDDTEEAIESRKRVADILFDLSSSEDENPIPKRVSGATITKPLHITSKAESPIKSKDLSNRSPGSSLVSKRDGMSSNAVLNEEPFEMDDDYVPWPSMHSSDLLSANTHRMDPDLYPWNKNLHNNGSPGHPPKTALSICISSRETQKCSVPQCLRNNHSVDSCIISMNDNHYVIGNEAGVLRLYVEEFKRGNVEKLRSQLSHVRGLYERVYVIVQYREEPTPEYRKAFGPAIQLEQYIMQLCVTHHVSVLHTYSMEETAQCLYDLALCEQASPQRKRIVLHDSIRNGQCTNKMKFLLSIPRMTWLTASNLLIAFQFHLSWIVGASVDQLVLVPGVSETLAKVIHTYVRRQVYPNT